MSWDRQLQQLASLDDADPQKWQAIEQLMQAVGGQVLQGHRIVQNRTDGGIEMRGVWHGYPVRMKVMLAFLDLEWEMKCSNPTGQTLYFFWDLDAVPAVGQFNADFSSAWDEDSETKVFFAKGMYLEASANEIEPRLAVYQALPDSVRQALVTFIPGDQISKLYCYGQGGLWLNWTPGLHELPDAFNRVARGVWLMGQLAWGLAQCPPAQGPTYAPIGSVHQMTCAYCRTIFLLGQSSACPNCGAPPQG